MYSTCCIQVQTDFQRSVSKVIQNQKESLDEHLSLHKDCRHETLYHVLLLIRRWDDISVVKMGLCIDGKGHCTWRSCEGFSPTDHKCTRQGQRHLEERGRTKVKEKTESVKCIKKETWINSDREASATLLFCHSSWHNRSKLASLLTCSLR